eukprot:642512-Rhodomonas_salina.3
MGEPGDMKIKYIGFCGADDSVESIVLHAPCAMSGADVRLLLAGGSAPACFHLPALRVGGVGHPFPK